MPHQEKQITGIWYLKKLDNGDIVLQNDATGKTIIDAFRFTENGMQVPVDLQVYANELNNAIMQEATLKEISAFTPDIVPQGRPSTFAYTFEQSSADKTLGTAVKITADIKGPASVSYGESVTVSDSFGGDISINAKIEDAIEGGASFTWENSLSSSAQFSVTYSIPAGKTGYIQFTPYYNLSTGTIVRRLYSPSLVKTERFKGWGRSPIKLSTGFADGIYALVTN